MNRYIVLDTNCLLQSLSRRSTYYKVWEDFILGKYTLCISNSILEEYEEIIASRTYPLEGCSPAEPSSVSTRAAKTRYLPFLR